MTDRPITPSPEIAEKQRLGPFLAQNPFPGKYTDGLYFRDKMRAIHRIAPQRAGSEILEIGGGQSGLTKMLYPTAQVTNLDADPAFADAACNRREGQHFVVGDATALPFEDASTDMVTMFDLLEHVPDDVAVAREAMRVLRPGGVILVSTPDLDRWKYPYYGVFSSFAPSEEELFAEWGHVRRGYTREGLETLFGGQAEQWGGFINPWLAVSHDIAFLRVPKVAKLGLHLAAAPISAFGWFRHRAGMTGTEIVASWSK